MPHVEVMPEEDAEGPSLTLTDMARQLQLAESTTRYYCKRFASFIPVVGEGRRRRYGPEALEVMRVIAEYMTSMRSATAVAEALEKRFPRVVDAAPVVAPLQADTPAVPTDAAPAAYAIPAHYLEQQTKAMQVMALTLDKVTRQQEALRRLAAASKAIVEENRALKQELASVRELLHTAELVHQEDLQQIRNWMGKIIRRGASPAAPQAATAPAPQDAPHRTADTAATPECATAPPAPPTPDETPSATTPVAAAAEDTTPDTATTDTAPPGEALPETAPAMFAPDAAPEDAAALETNITYITEDTSIHEEDLSAATPAESPDAATAQSQPEAPDATEDAVPQEDAVTAEPEAAAPSPEDAGAEAVAPEEAAPEEAAPEIVPEAAAAREDAPETTPEAATPAEDDTPGSPPNVTDVTDAADTPDAPDAPNAPDDSADMAGLSWRAPLPRPDGQ